MGRKPAPEPLTLSDARGLGENQSVGETRQAQTQVLSPPDSNSKAPTSPRSPFRFTPKKSQSGGGQQQFVQQADDAQHSSEDPPAAGQYIVSSAPSQQQSFISPALTPQEPTEQQRQESQTVPDKKSKLLKQSHGKHQRPRQQQQQNDQAQSADEDRPANRSGFFFNFKASKSSHQLHSHHHTDSKSKAQELPPMPGKISNKQSDSSYADHSVQKPIATLPSKSDLSLPSGAAEYEANPSSTPTSAGKNKPKPFALLGRTKSVRDKDGPSPKEPVTARLPEPERVQAIGFNGLKTAPAGHDRTFRDMMTSAVRNRSEDRSAPRDIMAGNAMARDAQSRTQPSSYQENGGSGFFNNFKSSSSKAANMISKGLFGKGGRERSHDREPVVDDEHYVLKVINRPLVEQTRLTRISKRLEDSRDKTEFWMPAFPWRAIDYLNYKGSDVEGLYRVPGSGPQIKKWQRKFDEEYDVDLFAQDDLYDINIIGSMLKAWLRELPDELFPKEAQDRISRECAGSETVPQLLVDELSNLSPFNYYLLFAITCHLSLLLAHSDKNKMDFRNLCICFQPCMKIDAFCFKFLVCDWRDCWKGCKNEAKFIEEEYMLFDQPPPRGLGEPRRPVQDELPPLPVSQPLEMALPTPPEQEPQLKPQPQSQPQPEPQPELQSQAPPSREQQQQPPVLIREPPQREPLRERERERDRNVSSSDSKQSGGQQSMENKQGRLKKKALPLSDSNGSVTSNATISTTLTINSDAQPPRVSGDLRPLSPIKPLSPLGF